MEFILTAFSIISIKPFFGLIALFLAVRVSFIRKKEPHKLLRFTLWQQFGYGYSDPLEDLYSKKEFEKEGRTYLYYEIFIYLFWAFTIFGASMIVYHIKDINIVNTISMIVGSLNIIVFIIKMKIRHTYFNIVRNGK